MVKNMIEPVKKIFCVLCLSSALSVTVITARAVQINREFEKFKDRTESHQISQDEKIATDYQRINDLERRINYLDQERFSDRLTRLEALSETTHELLIAIASAIGILMIETAIRLFSNMGKMKKSSASASD